MGNSFGGNRRRHNQQPPPHYHSTEPTFPFPQPPSPPSSYTTHHQNPYPTHPPPPPVTYASQPYNSRGYTNQMTGRFNNQPFYYASQPSGGWPAVRPSVQPVEPAPFVNHQNPKKVRNTVNVHKETLRVEIDEQNPDQYLVSFVFDAVLDGSITIFYFAKEESNCRFVPLFPEAHLPVKIPFQKGRGQKFCQISGMGIDLGFFELDELSKPSPEEDIFPLVVVAETCPSIHSTDEHDEDDSVSNTSNHFQITQAVLEKKNNDPFQVRVIRQILWIDGVHYELRDIYGIGTSGTEGFDDSDPGKECVICMTEPKDTAVLPCRHMCMCSECAKALRLQSNNCPICRQPIEELIEIKINCGNQ